MAGAYSGRASCVLPAPIPRSAVRRVALQGGRRPVAARAAGSPATTSAPRLVQLGDSDLMVPEICIGTMTWGVQNTEEEAHEQLSYALDEGINFMDTAEIYPVPTSAETQGRTDKYISTWLKQQKRDDIILATKVAGASPMLGYLREDGEGTRINKAQIVESVEKSLIRLGTDYIDLLQLHWPDRYVPLFGQDQFETSQMRESVSFEEQLLALQELIEAGKVRHIGVSNETPYGVSEFFHASKTAGLPKMISIQNCYNLIVRVPFETGLVETCAPSNCNVGLLAYSPLAGGALSGKHLKGEAPGSRFALFEGYMERYLQSRAIQAVAEYVKVAEKYDMTASELALAWCYTRPFVTSTIIGATTMDQLKENIKAYSIELPEDCVKDIEKVYKVFRDPSRTD